MSDKKVCAYGPTDMEGACGVGTLTGFTFQSKNSNDYWAPHDTLSTLSQQKGFGGGGKVLFLNFINNKVCKATYDWMVKRYPIMYQSPLIPNSYHSGRKSFFAIFNVKEKLPKDTTPEVAFPYGEDDPQAEDGDGEEW